LSYRSMILTWDLTTNNRHIRHQDFWHLTALRSQLFPQLRTVGRTLRTSVRLLPQANTPLASSKSDLHSFQPTANALCRVAIGHCPAAVATDANTTPQVAARAS